MSKVRIEGKDVSCCGVIKQGWEGFVKMEMHVPEESDLPSNILVLDDNTLVWKHQTREVQGAGH